MRLVTDCKPRLAPATGQNKTPQTTEYGALGLNSPPPKSAHNYPNLPLGSGEWLSWATSFGAKPPCLAKIPTTLMDLQQGETKAHACENAAYASYLRKDSFRPSFSLCAWPDDIGWSGARDT